MRKVLFTGWGTGDTHAGPSNLHTASTTGSTASSATPASTARSAARQHRFGQGFYRFKPDGSKLEFLRITNNNTWGVGFSEEGDPLRLDRQRQPQRLHADPQPLLRGGARLVVERCCTSIADKQQVPTDHRQGAAGRLPRRLHRRRPATPSTPPAAYPAGILEPHRVRHRADRAPGRHVRCSSRKGSDFRSRNALEPAGQRRRVDRPDHGRGRPRRQRLGDRLVQLHRAAQPDAARLQDRQGQRLRNASCATRRTAASTGSCAKDAKPSAAMSPRRTRRPRSWSRR